jgi:hypothetical protein
MHEEKSDVEESIELYTAVWKFFRDQPFEASELAKQLLKRDEYELMAEEGEPKASLDGLVDYGLLKTRDTTYQIVVDPNAVADELEGTESLRTAAVDQLIQSALVRTEGQSDSNKGLSFDGKSYTVVELSPETTVSEGVERVTEAASDDGQDGVVITTAGTSADRAQQIADQLIDTHENQWEKAGTDVVESDSLESELVFRLFLDP